MAEQGFTGKKVSEIIGITYRQLDYWARTDLVKPSLATAKGSGSRRMYSYSDLLELKVVKALLDGGTKLESIREVFKFMREELDEDVKSATLVIDGPSILWVKSEQEIINLLDQPGQGMLQVLKIAPLTQQLDEVVVEMGNQMGGSSTNPRPQANSAIV